LPSIPELANSNFDDIITDYVTLHRLHAV